jgi:uncharacterized membrane protein YkvI
MDVNNTDNQVPPDLPAGQAGIPLPSTRLATVSLILGVISVGALAALCFAFYAAREAVPSQAGHLVTTLLSRFEISFGSSAAGLVTGVVALRRRTPKRSRAVIGVILSGLVFAVLLYFIWLTFQFAP